MNDFMQKVMYPIVNRRKQMNKYISFQDWSGSKSRNSSNQFVENSIHELLGENFAPTTKEYSSGTMNEFQNMIYLIAETDKILFPRGEGFMATIIKEEYDRSKGTQGVLEIIRKYVNWIDTDGKF